MKQAYMPGPGKIVYRDAPRPVAESDCVIIKVARIGICGSDLHVFKGKHPLVSYPLVQGHEFSGYIDEIGKNVRGLSVGDLVAVQPAVGCGSCQKCSVGLIAQCDKLRFIGGSLPGGGSEYFSVDSAQVIKMPEGASPDEGAMVEPLAVAIHAVSRCHSVKGKDILIVGGGTIGNLIAQTARSFGARRAIIADRIPFRRSLLETMGFDTIEPKEATLSGRETKALFGGPPPLAFECAGNAAALNCCIRTVSRGGTIVIVGVYEEPPKAEMILVQDKELVLTGSLMYSSDDYRRAVALIKDGAVNLMSLVTHHIPFDRWEEGYELLLRRPDKALKVIVDL